MDQYLIEACSVESTRVKKRSWERAELATTLSSRVVGSAHRSAQRASVGHSGVRASFVCARPPSAEVRYPLCAHKAHSRLSSGREQATGEVEPRQEAQARALAGPSLGRPQSALLHAGELLAAV